MARIHRAGNNQKTGSVVRLRTVAGCRRRDDAVATPHPQRGIGSPSAGGRLKRVAAVLLLLAVTSCAAGAAIAGRIPSTVIEPADMRGLSEAHAYHPLEGPGIDPRPNGRDRGTQRDKRV
jgi:hypothetical protein